MTNPLHISTDCGKLATTGMLVKYNLCPYHDSVLVLYPSTAAALGQARLAPIGGQPAGQVSLSAQCTKMTPASDYDVGTHSPSTGPWLQNMQDQEFSSAACSVLHLCGVKGSTRAHREDSPLFPLLYATICQARRLIERFGSMVLYSADGRRKSTQQALGADFRMTSRVGGGGHTEKRSVRRKRPSSHESGDFISTVRIGHAFNPSQLQVRAPHAIP